MRCAALLRAHPGVLFGLVQDVVDGLAVAQPLDRLGEVAVAEPGDGCLLECEVPLHGVGPRGESGLVRLGLLREPGLEGRGLLAELRLDGGAFGGEPLFPAAHIRVTLLGVLGLGREEVVLRTAQLGPGPDEEPYTGGACDGDRGTRERRGYLDLFRSRHCGGDGSGS